MDRKIDGQLVLAYRSGDRSALAKLVKRWHRPFCNKAYWIVKDADLAKDIAQDAWATVIDRIGSLKEVDRFGSWAIRIVYSKSLDELRRISRKRTRQEDYAKDLRDQVLTESDDTDQQLKIQLLQSIKRLSDHQQVVIKLFYVEDYSLKDISDILNISVGTAKSRLFHAREKLKTSLNIRNHEK